MHDEEGSIKQKARENPRFFAHGVTFFVTSWLHFLPKFPPWFFYTCFLLLALALLFEALGAALASALVTLSFQVPF